MKGPRLFRCPNPDCNWPMRWDRSREMFVCTNPQCPDKGEYE